MNDVTRAVYSGDRPKGESAVLIRALSGSGSSDTIFFILIISSVDSLERTYLRGLFIFLAAFLAVLSIGLVYPFYRTEKLRLEGELERTAETKAVYADLFIKNSIEKVAATGSRSQIRAALVEYAAGMVSLEDLRQFTQQKYQDGLMVYDDVVAAVRYDAVGMIVAIKGNRALLPFKALAASDRILTLRRLENEVDDGGAVFGLEIRHPLVDKGRVIGQDALLFNAGAFHTELGPLTYRLYQNGDALYEGAQSAWRKVDTSYPSVSLAYKYPDRAVRPQWRSFLNPFLRFTLLLIVLVGIVAYFTLYRSSRRLLDSLHDLADRRALLIRETNHRVKNNLTVISSFVNLCRQEVGGENGQEAQDVLETIESKIGLIGLIHDRLYRQPDTDSVALKPYLMEMATTILDAHSTPGTYTCIIEGSELSVRDDVCAGVGIIVSELILNAIKYALGPGDGVWINLSGNGARWSLAFENSGRPYPEDAHPETSTGFGSELIRLYTAPTCSLRRTPTLPTAGTAATYRPYPRCASATVSARRPLPS